MKSDPDSENALFGIGQLYIEMGAPQKSIEHLDTAIRNNPKSPWLLFCRAKAFRNAE